MIFNLQFPGRTFRISCLIILLPYKFRDVVPYSEFHHKINKRNTEEDALHNIPVVNESKIN